MKLKNIETESDYKLALKRLEEIFDVKKGTSEGEELEVLGILIEKYENKYFAKSRRLIFIRLCSNTRESIHFNVYLPLA